MFAKVSRTKSWEIENFKICIDFDSLHSESELRHRNWLHRGPRRPACGKEVSRRRPEEDSTNHFKGWSERRGGEGGGGEEGSAGRRPRERGRRGKSMRWRKQRSGREWTITALGAPLFSPLIGWDVRCEWVTPRSFVYLLSEPVVALKR